MRRRRQEALPRCTKPGNITGERLRWSAKCVGVYDQCTCLHRGHPPGEGQRAQQNAEGPLSTPCADTGQIFQALSRIPSRSTSQTGMSCRSGSRKTDADIFDRIERRRCRHRQRTEARRYTTREAQAGEGGILSFVYADYFRNLGASATPGESDLGGRYKRQVSLRRVAGPQELRIIRCPHRTSGGKRVHQNSRQPPKIGVAVESGG